RCVESIVSGSGPRPTPAAHARARITLEAAVELAPMPERKRAQKRAQPRGRHHAVPEHPLPLAATQHARVVDRITANKRRTDNRQTVPPSPSRTRPRTEINRLIHDPLDPEPPGEPAREHKARVRDRALIIKSKREPIDAPPDHAEQHPPQSPPHR